MEIARGKAFQVRVAIINNLKKVMCCMATCCLSGRRWSLL